ncbi:MAG: hypothetical protein ACT443_14255 [Gemmatimonadota bacterium]
MWRCATSQIAGLPQRLRGNQPAEPADPVEVSRELSVLQREVGERVR